MAEDDDLGFDEEPVPAAEERLHPILSNVEFLEAQGKARAKIEKERRVAAAKQVEETEARRLRVEEGLVTGIGVKDEMVNVTIDLPEFGAHLRINEQLFHHGHTYLVPRHQADSLAEMMSRAWQHEDEVKGRSRAEHYGTARHVKINAVTGAVTKNPQVVYDA